MEEKDIQTTETETETTSDAEDATLLRDVLSKAKVEEDTAKEEQTSEETTESDTEETETETEETATAEAETEETEVKETDTKPDVKTFTEEDLQARIQEERRKASQEAADAVYKKFMSKEDAALQKIRDLEAVFGVDLDTVLRQGRESKVREATEEFAMDEEAARKYVATQEENARFKAQEQQRAFEHKMQTMRTEFERSRLQFYTDTQADPAVKTLAQKYEAEISSLAEDAFAGGQEMSYDVARTYVLGQHITELIKEQKAEQDRLKTAAQQKALKDVQQRAKAAPESASTSAPQSGGLDRGDKAFLKKLGLDDKAIAEIETERSRKKKK